MHLSSPTFYSIGRVLYTFVGEFHLDVGDGATVAGREWLEGVGLVTYRLNENPLRVDSLGARVGGLHQGHGLQSLTENKKKYLHQIK